MDLHRSKRPDWQNISPERQTVLQHIAAATGGVVTVGNFVTVFGFIVVLFGIDKIIVQQYWIAFVALIVGRCQDVVDGWAAQQTQTKSPLGELLDAGLDKVGTCMTIVVLYSYNDASWWILLLLVLPHIFISTITFISIKQRKHLHPSTRGKISMASAWLSLLGFVAMRATNVTFHSTLGIATYTTAVLSIAIGMSATLGYTRELHKVHAERS
jgi:phosphatidylglycerophosphate synthase